MTELPLPYGSWPSPIDAATVARHDGAPNWPEALGEEVWWAESRPEEDGRVALVRTRLDRDDPPQTVLPAPWNARSRVHEYGGQPYTLLADGPGTAVVFSEYGDQRLYRYSPESGGDPTALTPVPEIPSGLRYIEPIPGPRTGEVWCVRESFTGPAPTDVTRAIVAVPLDGSAVEDPALVREVAAGHRFLTCPRLSPDGRRLAWIGWNHPDMPWDATELRVADVDVQGRAVNARTVAGGPREAVVQVEWAGPDRLYYVSDPEGWWNPFRLTIGPDGDTVEPLGPVEEEFGGPLWQLGARWLRPLPDGRVAAVHGTATTRIAVTDPRSGRFFDLATPFTEWSPRLTLAGTDRTTIVSIAASAELPHEVVALEPDKAAWRSLSRPRGAAADDPLAPYLSAPLPRVFTCRPAEGGEREVHSVVHPPRNPSASGPEGAPAPYAVWVHGGPNSRAPMVHDLEIAFFTSRGIGVAVVNYGGSTGFGRAYRERLRENWGVVDVEDCAAVAGALADEGTADPARIAIRGGSAGGWTSAAALASTDVFSCATIQYPILDLAGWRNGETHDFESQYLETLVGPWPQTRDRYEERSPVNRAASVTAPFVLMQGLEDLVCPPVQCDRFLEQIAALAADGKGVPHAYLTFAGEQHGFRKEATIVAALQAELSLYAQVFGFEPAGDLPVLELRP